MKLANVCPDIPDDWRGGRAETARILGGISPKTLDRKADLGKRKGGIDWLPGKRGRIFLGKEVKRFWREYR